MKHRLKYELVYLVFFGNISYIIYIVVCCPVRKSTRQFEDLFIHLKGETLDRGFAYCILARNPDPSVISSEIFLGNHMERK